MVVVEWGMVYKVVGLDVDTFALREILETYEKSSFLQLGIYTYNMQ
ncbi:VrrA protein product [Bacillus cereus Rock3-28]|nr:VrrA protein product [Bacillus cereus Rock3-28]